MNAPVVDSAHAAAPSSRGAWMALVAALLGWMFDGAEMGLFSMVGNAAVADLLEELGQADKASRWFGIIIATFLMGAATGGVVFGWLGDRIGRVRAMSLSVLVYALFTGFCGLAQTVEQLAVLRFIASLGMGGEWALGVALVMEVWPNKSRAFMAGLIGAAANVGYLIVGLVGLVLDALLKDQIPTWLAGVGFGSETIAFLTAHKGWRLMMMMGTTPALLTFLIRIFVPESHKWEEEKAKGSTSHWATTDLFGVLIGTAGPTLIICTWAYDFTNLWGRMGLTLLGLVIAGVGFTFPVVRYLQRSDADAPAGQTRSTGRIVRRMLLAACLSGVALIGTWASTQWAAKWAGQLTNNEFQSREWTQIWLAIGACVGTILAAMMGDWFGRRMSYFLLCLGALASAEFLYYFNESYNAMFLASTFVAGALTASFYGWLPLYLPELFPTRVRATGQGFGFNFGRILAAIGALQAGVLTELFHGDFPKAGMVMSLVYLVGMVVIWFAPETRGKPLPE
jgi:SHS family sialic acid transporter-like MFS transporter